MEQTALEMQRLAEGPLSNDPTYLAEAVNALPQKDDTDAAYRELREHFNETETAELSYAIAVIKGWNVINLSLRNQIPEVPAPGF